MHKLVIKAGFESDIMIEIASLICMANVESPEASKEFERLQNYEDASTWGIIIDGYAQQGNISHALHLFGRMLEHCVIPDRIALVSAVKGCGDLGSVERDMLLNHLVIESEFLKDVQV
mgnify:CR=1 FL=1